MIVSSKPSQLNNISTIRKKKQELIVEINIGKKYQKKSIWLSDMYDMANIEHQIKRFIKNNGLKNAAFSFIKQIIVEQIDKKKSEINFQSNCRCFQACQCINKYDKVQVKNNQIFQSISNEKDSKNQTPRTPQLPIPKQPQHLSIKITPKINDILSTNVRNQQVSSFVFNSSFTLPSSIGEKQRYFLTDQLYENVLQTSQNKSSTYFSNMSEFKSKEKDIPNKFTARNNDIDFHKYLNPHIPIDQIKPLQTSFSKNSPYPILNTPKNLKPKLSIDKKSKPSLTTPLQAKKSKIMSTKERKDALMTPQKGKVMQQLIHLNGQNLQSMIMQHKKELRDGFDKFNQSMRLEPSIQNKKISSQFQDILHNLFMKLTVNNPLNLNEIHSQYVSYQLLQRQQLHFMGVLFQRIDHKELNNLNFNKFRNSSLKYCWNQLLQLSSIQMKEKKKKISC